MTDEQKMARKRLIKRRAKLLARLRAIDLDEPNEPAPSTWDAEIPDTEWLDA